MASCLTCNVCDLPASFGPEAERARVPSNVRKFAHEVFTVWRCAHCGSLHCKEDADLRRYYEDYPVARRRLDFGTRAAFANLLQRLRRCGLKREHEILDVGCGTGLFIEFLTESGYRNVTGYDEYIGTFRSADVLRETYDWVISMDVIEHAEHPVAFFQRLVGLARRGGTICIGTPNATRIDLARTEDFPLSLHQPYHRHILSEKALLALGEVNGLTCLAVYRRFYHDTWLPTLNYRFICSYVKRAGNCLDVCFEPPRAGMAMGSPSLWLDALFGYLYPPRSEMMVCFRKQNG